VNLLAESVPLEATALDAEQTAPNPLLSQQADVDPMKAKTQLRDQRLARDQTLAMTLVAPGSFVPVSETGRHQGTDGDSNARLDMKNASFESLFSEPPVGTLHRMLSGEESVFLAVKRHCQEASGASESLTLSHQVSDDFTSSDTAFLILDSHVYAGQVCEGARVKRRDLQDLQDTAPAADVSSNLDSAQGQEWTCADLTQRQSAHEADPNDELEQEIQFYRKKVRGYTQTPLPADGPSIHMLHTFAAPLSKFWSRTRHAKEESGNERTEALPWGLGLARCEEHAVSQEKYLGSWVRGLPHGDIDQMCCQMLVGGRSFYTIYSTKQAIVTVVN
jgi:hypothetical protein